MKKINNPSAANKRKKPFSAILFSLMIILPVLEFVIFFSVMLIGGEFTTIKKYAYDILSEKTDTRRISIENLLNSKTAHVYQSSEAVNRTVDRILADMDLDIGALKTDKELNRRILSETAQALIYLMRTDQVNDAYIVLDTGELYGEDGRRAGIYLRDTDINDSNISENTDLFMEMGSSEIARELNIVLDFEWAAHMPVNDSSVGTFDFFKTSVDTAKNNPDLSPRDLGYWSGYSRISRSAQPSIKYTIPLRTSDGAVYGVIGVGLMEKTVLSQMTTNDYLRDGACYMLAADFDGSGDYDVLSHSGAFYSRVRSSGAVLNAENGISELIYRFGKTDDSDIIGCIHDINLYKTGSPYIDQDWAVISAADSGKILEIYNGLITMLFISTAISAVLNILFALLINKRITSPVENIIRTLDTYNESNDIISFGSSDIAEIDRLADAIAELQVNVRESSSRVSRIISMADMGIGVFMYDIAAGSVFVGESLLRLLNYDKTVSGDMNISIDSFMEYINRFDKKKKISRSPVFTSDDSDNIADTIEVVCADEHNKTARWLKFSITKDKNHIIGLVQDTTNLVIEKKKIEYERDHDLTTGLLNRRAFYYKVEHIFSRPEKLRTAAFIIWDLDNLKYVNDTYGHDFGDDYIKTAANVFKLFSDHNGIPARLSGDEFIVFLYGFESKDEIRQIIADVRNSLAASYCILTDGTHYKIRASGGISWYPDNSTSYEMLIKYADFAMYEIKHSTKGNVAEFNMSDYNKDYILTTGVEEMNRIIEEQSVKYALQSIYSVDTGGIYGYEALMRPQSEIFKSPLEFIRIARTDAKLYEVERLTMMLAMAHFRDQCQKGHIAENAKIFVNSLLSCMMKSEDMEIFERENKDYLSRIVLEFLESDSSNDEYTNAKQKTVKKWNAMIALDDFGSGYNSDFAIINYNPNIIKIDHAIICGCDRDVSRMNIITNLVALAKPKNILVLAEGVETYAEMKTVIGCGVDLMQGYYLSRPMFDPLPADPKISAEIRELKVSAK